MKRLRTEEKRALTKEEFLKLSFDKQKSVKITRQNIEAVLAEYKKKGVTIHISGTTDFGQAILHEMAEADKLFLNDLKEKKDMQLPLFYQRFFRSKEYDYEIYREYELNLAEVEVDIESVCELKRAKDDLAEDGFLQYIEVLLRENKLMDGDYIKPDITPEEFQKLNEILSHEHTVRKKWPYFKKILDNYFTDIQSKGLRKQYFVHNDAELEMKHIQKNLGLDDVVGYIYLQPDITTEDDYIHAECFLITKEKIIKPNHSVNWDELNEFNDGTIIYKQPHQTIKGKNGWQFPHPQGGGFECATLSILTLKALLKNNAAEFKKHCMTFPFVGSSGAVEGMFIPAPTTFKYSQSSFYLELFEDFMTSQGKELRKEHDKHIVYTYPLNQLLHQAFGFARNNQNAGMTKSLNQAVTCLHGNAGEFLSEWKNRYKIAVEKRKKMNVACTKRNANLAYYTHKFSKMG